MKTFLVIFFDKNNTRETMNSILHLILMHIYKNNYL